MSYLQFKQLLKNVPDDIQIDFTGFCEPFLNPDAAWMMWHAAKQGYKVVLITTLTGFTEKDALILSTVKFDKLLVHEYEGTAINMDLFESKLALLRKWHEVESFKLTPEFRWSRAGNLWEMPIKSGKFECGWTGKEFYCNVVLPNGDVYLCCMDYSLKHCIGNLYTTHYNDLYRQMIVDLSNKEDSDCICRQCEMIKISE